MSEPDLPDALLGRFLSGEASAADRVAVETWAAADPAHRAELDRLLAITPAAPTQAWDVDRAWRQTAAAIRRPDETAVVAISRPVRRRVLVRLAAAFVLVFGLLYAWRQLGQVPAPTVYATGLGERLEVDLPDGTVAVLAPWSTLTVPAGFGNRSRRVTLDGEAWFEASHEQLAFEVVSGEYLVRDIGTQFSVARREAAPLEVVVVVGEVQVRVLADTATLLASLAAGDVGHFARPDSMLEHEASLAHAQPVGALTTWRTGTLELVDAPVADVIARLAAWHGVAIRVTPQLSQGRTITATLPLDSLDGAIDVLATLLGADVVREPGGVRLQ